MFIYRGATGGPHQYERAVFFYLFVFLSQYFYLYLHRFSLGRLELGASMRRTRPEHLGHEEATYLDFWYFRVSCKGCVIDEWRKLYKGMWADY